MRRSYLITRGRCRIVGKPEKGRDVVWLQFIEQPWVQYGIILLAVVELLRDFRNRAMAGRWELTEEQWELVEPILRPNRRKDTRGRPWHDTRAVLHGVFWVLGTGAHWSELPVKYPPYQTCHHRFQQCAREGKLVEVLRR